VTMIDKKPITILAIESSCDETAAAILSWDGEKTGLPKTKTLSSVIRSQIKLHSKMGGVVPEVAARAHVKNILPVVQKTINDSRLTINDINYIAVTAGPGLIPSLIVGVEFAKALALATGKKMVPINHLEGHLYSPFGQLPTTHHPLPTSLFPMISLIVSGGHTILTLMESEKKYRVLGQTVDDAAGEAFDKVAKLLGLPYPGGPEVSRLAEKGRPSIDFPRPMINSKDFNFSFAGLKTAVLYYIRAKGQGLSAKEKQLSPIRLALSAKADICSSFQQAAVDVLVAKTTRATKKFKAKAISLSGGVSANASLRSALRKKCADLGLRFFAPSLKLSTDNAEMIGLAAIFKLRGGYKPVKFNKVKADPNLQL